MAEQSQPLKGALWLAAAILSWGALFSVAKRTLPVLDPFFLGAFRYAAGILIFVAILWASEGRQALRYGGRFVPAALFGVVGFCGFNVLVWWGLVYTRPEHASVIMTLQTPMVALALWFMRGLRPSNFTIGCVALAIAGVVTVVTRGDPAHALAGGSLAGDLLVFLGAVSWMVYTLAGGYFSGWSPLRMTVLTCIPGTIGLIAINAFTIGMGYTKLPGLEQIASVWWQLAYFVVFSVILGVLGFNNAVKHLGALNTMLTMALIPVIVFGIEAALGQSFSAVEVCGATIVIGALVANNLYLRRSFARP